MLLALLTIFNLGSFAQSWEYLSTSLSEQYYHSSYYSDGTDIYMIGQENSVLDLELLKWNQSITDWELVSTSTFPIDARMSKFTKHSSGKFVISVIEESSNKLFMYLYDSVTSTWSELISSTVNNTWNSSSVYDFPEMAINPVNGNIGISYIASLTPNGSFAPVVLEYNGTNLSLLGSGNPRAVLATGSSELCSNVNITYTADGKAHVIFGPMSNAIGPFVASFDGTNWIDRGGITGFATTNYYNQIITNTTGEVFVSFADFTNNATVLLKTSDFINWTPISSYIGTSDKNSLSKLNDGTIYHRFNNSGYIVNGLSVTDFTGSTNVGLWNAKIFSLPNDEYLLFGFDSQVYGKTRSYYYHLIPQLPTVTTQAVNDINVTSAIGNGNITNLGVPNPTQYGVCWNTTGNPTIADSKTEEGATSATGAFTSSITGLSNCQTYYVRAYATNTEGTSYGAEVSFTTLDNTNPTISSTHNDQQVDANASCEASLPDYTGDITATDNCDADLDVTQSPIAGSTISGTSNTVTLTVTDDAGNFAEVSFNVEVVDNTNPVITCIGNIEVDETHYTVQGTEFDPTETSDNCGVDNVKNDFNNLSTLANAQLPEGTTTIVWTITDIAGNENTCSFDVTVNLFVGIETLQQNGISIYPNPTNGIVNFDFSNLNVNKISISDITGKVIIEKIVTNQEEKIDISNYSNGVYLIKFQTEKEVLSTKIIKEH